MITLYIRDRCENCNKARTWLQENRIPFIERNIASDPLTFAEFIEILRLTDNGTEDIISKGSYVFKKINIDQLQLKELYSLIQKKPSILITPIIHDGKRLLVGFNKYQIRMFLPKSFRLSQLYEAEKMLN